MIDQQRPEGAKHILSFRSVEGVVTDAWNTDNLQAEKRDKGGRGLDTRFVGSRGKAAGKKKIKQDKKSLSSGRIED